MSAWVSVKQKPVPRDVIVLVTDGRGLLQLTCRGKVDGYFQPIGFDGYEWDWDFDIEAVTHWMRAPIPPRRRVKKERTVA
jgi:hypothetical protein